MKKYIILAILVLSLPAFAQFSGGDGPNPVDLENLKDLPSPEDLYDSEGWEPPTIYATREECEQETGSLCSYAMCDYIPKGKTQEEICGDGLKKGWVANTNFVDDE
ncbi:MAG: hypothetical protein GC137_05925 [Alphaproteobacteria bacterium]|nr:hypothetical protein [Alphaproteobacteria bacterium]